MPMSSRATLLQQIWALALTLLPNFVGIIPDDLPQ